MTIAASFHTGDFIFFVADTRETLPPTFEGPAFVDSREKIVDVEFGLAAFAGNAGLGDFGTYVMGQYKDPRGVSAAIKKSLEVLTADRSPEFRAKAIADTTWMVSYRNQAGLVLAGFDHSRNHEEWVISIGQYLLAPPADLSQTHTHDLDNFVQSEFRRIMAIPGPSQAKLEPLAQMTEHIVVRSSELCATVSPTFQFGLHMPSGAKHVSDVMTAAKDCQWRARTLDQQ